MPIAAAQTPTIIFVRSLASTGSPSKAFGAAAASVTGAANAATTPLINNDVFLAVPKAFHALDVAVVEAFNVGGAVLKPGQFVDAIKNGRTNILGALDQPVGPTDYPDRRHQHIASGVGRGDQRCDGGGVSGGRAPFGRCRPDRRRRSAGTCAIRRSGAALAAGADQATQTLATAGGIVRDAVHTALTNVRDSLADPFPSTARVAATKADPPAALAAGSATNRTARHTTPKITADEQPDVSIATKNAADESTDARKPADSADPDHSGASSSVSPGRSTGAGRSAGCCSNDNATPSAKKNRMNSGPPR